MTLVIKQGEIGAFVGDYFHQWINTKSFSTSKMVFMGLNQHKIQCVFTVMKEHIHNKEE